MTQALDPRIIKVTVEVNGQLRTYSSPMNIVATGTKYGNALQNDATISIDNLEKSVQDYLLTETSPYNLNRTPKTITLEAGRESYGTAVIYRGNVVSIIVSQPPDITVTMKCLTGNFAKGNIVNNSLLGYNTYQDIAQKVAGDLSVNLNFQATNKNINNYNFTGSSLKQVELLGQMGNYNAFIDNDVLVVKDAFIPLTGTTRILNQSTGMIGIPEFTEQGLRVKFLLDNITTLGSGLEIQSDIYPAANGQYVIYKLGFQIATRDTPFYYIAEAARRR